MRAYQLAAACAAALLATAAPTLAKETEPGPAAKATSTVSGVTVTGEKPNPLVDTSSQFVRQHLPESTYSEQFPRFRDHICVKVQGLPAEFDAFVSKRLTEIAAQVGAPLAKAADCTPNVNVIFSTTPEQQLADIAKRKDILIGFHYVAQTKTATTFSRPIQAWYVTRTRDDTDNSFIEVATLCPASPPAVYTGPCSDRPKGRAGSRLSNGMSAEIVHSLIIADAAKVAGEKIDAVADYVAILALARWTGIERCNRVSTVLNLMADGCDAADRPEAATTQDIALLKGLYAVDPHELGSQQRATIASAMRKAATDDGPKH